ncbi:MAG: cyclic nucleotide-binding domain-containing protein [Bauldia sp.]
MDDVDPRDVIGAIPLFADALDEAQRDSLAARCHIVTFRKGAEMMTEGEFGSSMFAIVAGTVAVTVADRRGAEHDVAHLGEGEIVGEMSLLTGARRSATVVVSDEVVALEITKVALEQVLARAPDLIDRFGAILARRQAELDRVAKAHSGEDLAHRIRHFFTRR